MTWTDTWPKKEKSFLHSATENLELLLTVASSDLTRLIQEDSDCLVWVTCSPREESRTLVVSPSSSQWERFNCMDVLLPREGKGYLEKGKATCSSILAWRIPWTVYSMGLQESDALSDFHFHFSLLPEGFPVALAEKNPLAVKNAGEVREWGLIPGSEDPLEKEMATHSSILAWRIPWTEEPGGLQSTGVAKSLTRLK